MLLLLAFLMYCNDKNYIPVVILSLDAEQKDALVEIIEKLLQDKTTVSLIIIFVTLNNKILKNVLAQ